MKFEIEAEELIKVLSAMSRITNKAKINSLKNVCILNNGQTIRLIATDMNVGLRWDLEANNIEGEGCVYNLSQLLAIVSRQKSIIQVDDNNIKSGRSKYKINVLDIDNFPKLDFIVSDNSQELKYNELKNAINKTGYAVQKSIGVLAGIYFNNGDVVATDGNRLVISKMENAINDIILPKTFTDEVVKLPFAEDVIFSIKDNRVILCDSNITLMCNHLAGCFPKYEQLLPKSYKNTVVIKSVDLLEAINLITPIIDSQAMACKLIIDNNIVTVMATKDNEEGKTDFEVAKSDVEETLEIGFNATYLMEMIKAFGSEEVEMGINDIKSAIGFTSGNDFSIVMPMILQK